LRDKVHIAPTSAKYKVYIIDEVHMLTKEAFNALLKTLEEPPAHVIFMLATTEVHKLPETIISRTQRFAFKPVELDKVAAHLKYIAEQEKIPIEDEALSLIAAHGEGSFRDSISLLDQVRHSGGNIVTAADVQAVLGIAPATLIGDIIQAVGQHDPATVAAHLQKLQDQGYESAQAARQIGQVLRSAIVTGKKEVLSGDIAMQLLPKLLEVPSSSNPRAYLEIALLDAALDAQAATTPKTSPQPPQTPAKQTKVMPEEVQTKPAVQVEHHPSSFRKHATAAPVEASAQDPVSEAVLDEAVWQQVLAAIKQKHNTLYSVIRTAAPRFEAGTITLDCAFAFHKKQLSENRNKQIISDVVHDISGHAVRIQCIVGKSETAAPAAVPLPPADEQTHTVQSKPAGNKAVETISNIFGGAEVLES